jgi:hypothetical protein
LSKIDWNAENVAKLLACTSDDELRTAFPGTNLETLKRKSRSVKASDDTLEVESAPSLTITGDSGAINTGTVDAPITDWTDTLKIWGLDPEIFEVVQPVAMKAWGIPDNFRYSYSARIQKKVVTENPEDKLDIAGWRENLRNITTFSTSKESVTGPHTYLILVADPQLGKPGTEEAVENWRHGLNQHVHRVANLMSTGYNIEGLALAFMGDEHEGAVGNYASQPYEVELSYADQIELDFDMRVWSIREMLGLDLPIEIMSVPSNHGEHTRFGTNKVLTSIYDNSSTMVASLTQKVFEGTNVESRLFWNIAKDRQDVNINLSGIDCNFTHGHISKGSGSPTGGLRSKSALEKQILGRRDELTNTNLFFTAHYHHFNVIEDRGRTFFGCPALEAEKSSQWFYDSAGVWSRPGMLGMLVGNTSARGWGELEVI